MDALPTARLMTWRTETSGHHLTKGITLAAPASAFVFAIGSLVIRTGLVAAIALPLLAQTGNPASQAPQIWGTGSLTGTVTELGSDAPIGDAIVYLTVPNDPGWRRTVVTDDTGQFSFRSLPKGVYRLRVEADGFVSSALGQDRPNQIERAQDASLARTLELDDGEALKGTTIRMWRKAGVGGFVGDDFGEPVVGVPVSAIARAVDWTGVRMRVAATVTTDDRMKLVRGDVAAAAGPAEITVTMTNQPSEISGRLIDKAGAPAADMVVLVVPEDRRYWLPGSRRIQVLRLASDGGFKTTGLPAGTYRVVTLSELDPDLRDDPTFLDQVASTGLRVVLKDGEKWSQTLRVAG